MLKSKIEKYLQKVVGKEVDHILLNTQPISDIILDRYAQSGEHPVVNDLKADHRLIKAPILSDQFSQSYFSDASYLLPLAGRLKQQTPFPDY